MVPYQTKTDKLAGSNFQEVYKKALSVYKPIKQRTKRQTYIRSVYFKKEKIFLNIFWNHLFDKSWGERTKRLQYFACAIDLIKNSRNQPTSKENPNKSGEILHRFAGLTKQKELFFVQIKENKKSGNKYLMSVFPGD